MSTVSPEEAERRLAALARTLPKTDVPIASLFAQAVLARAVARAATRPTPQARMAATAAYAKGAYVRINARQRVYGFGSTSEVVQAGDIAKGSEFGTIGKYPQFQAPHTSKGYWLYPAARDADEDRALTDKADRALQSLIDATAGAGASIQTLQSLLGRIVSIH